MRYKNVGRAIALFLVCVLYSISSAQTFTYSGYIRNADGTGAVNVPVKLYKRTTPVMTGFTNQQNWNGHSYYRSTGSMTWTDARQACINMGGHLVTSTSLAENNFLFSLWPNGWIGLTDEQTEGVWRWVTGEPYSWSYWNSGEPNNAGNEDYIQFVGGGRWNDLPNTSLPYVLEFEYVVTFTPWVLHQTVYTNSAGYYSFSQPSSPAVEWYLQLDAPNPVTTQQLVDIQGVNNVVLGTTIRKSIHFHQYDVNGDGRITVSDAVFINLKRVGLVSNWVNRSPSALYTPAQFTSLNNGTADLRSSIPGVLSITINSPTSGTTTGNYYLIAPGYKGQVSY
jgi:hypothetical protein